MLKIRLFRTGKKHQPSYKIVVIDKNRAPRGGRFVDELGFLNPKTKGMSLDKEKAKHWISKGAQLSDTIHNLFIREGIIKAQKIDVHKKSKKKEKKEKKEEPKPEEKPAEKPVKEPKPEEESKRKEKTK